MRRAFFYCRVATERQARKGDSLKVQKAKMFAKLDRGFHSFVEMLNIVRLWKPKDVHVRILDDSVSKAERRV
jgi:hypothetical protein